MTVPQDPRVTLRSLVGNHAGTDGAEGGPRISPLVAFEFADVEVVNTQFKAMMRDLKYRLRRGRHQHLSAGIRIWQAVRAAAGDDEWQQSTSHDLLQRGSRSLTPGELNGKRVGVRAYSQTTGVWVRGFLAEDYGVDLQSITWVTFEEPHLAEYREPANVERAPAGKALKQMLLDGEIDAAILGDVAEEGSLKHLDSGSRRGRDSAGRGRTAACRSTIWRSSGGRLRSRALTWFARSIAC